MTMVCGLDLHRQQITFDAELGSGEVWRGRIGQPDRARFRRWLAEEVAPRATGDQVELAVEGCTGWRFVCEEIAAAGFVAHVAEPAETQAARGPKRRAKTDRSDAALLRRLLADGTLPESWIPPELVLEWRELVRLHRRLIDHRTQWAQRIHAECYQHGVAVAETSIRSTATRERLCGPEVALSPAARRRIETAYSMMDAIDTQAGPLALDIRSFGAAQPGCRAVVEAHWGIGPLLAVAVWSELGDCRRFSRSEQAVRAAGLDITVDSSDRRRANGFLSRQGAPILRWALYEAAQQAARPNSPDHDYYRQVRRRHDNHKIACLSVARQLARRCYHTLRAVDPEQVYATP